MKPHFTIKSPSSPKDPLDNSEKSCLVYQVLCRDCSFVYIGQTKRDLISRLDEHKRAIKNQRPDLSAFCEHSNIRTTFSRFTCPEKTVLFDRFVRKRKSCLKRTSKKNRYFGTCKPANYLLDKRKNSGIGNRLSFES